MIFMNLSMVQVGWDESTGGEKQPRVSLWEIEPLTTFPMYASPFSLGLKRPWPSGLPSLHGASSVCFLKLRELTIMLETPVLVSTTLTGLLIFPSLFWCM